jgi:lipoprotein signal peptidase
MIVRRNAAAILTAVFLFSIERVVTHTLVDYLQKRGGVIEFGDSLALSLHRNYGFAFSVPLQPMIGYTVSVSVLIFICLIFYRQRDKNFGIPLASFILICTGSTSNLIARLMEGYVWDYLSVRIFSVTGFWNIADIMILVGVATWVLTAGYNHDGRDHQAVTHQGLLGNGSRH